MAVNLNFTITELVGFISAFVFLCFGLWQWYKAAKLNHLQVVKVMAETDASKSVEATNMMQVVNIVLASIATLNSAMTSGMNSIRAEFATHASQDAVVAKDIHLALSEIQKRLPPVDLTDVNKHVNI